MPRVQCTLVFHPFSCLVVIQGGMLLLPFQKKGRKGSFLDFTYFFVLYSNPLSSQRPRVLGPAPLHVLDIQKNSNNNKKQKNIFSFLLGKWESSSTDRAWIKSHLSLANQEIVLLLLHLSSLSFGFNCLQNENPTQSGKMEREIKCVHESAAWKKKIRSVTVSGLAR